LNKTILLAIVFLCAVAGYLLFSTIGLRRYRCEVCINYRGNTACGKAAASTREQALRTATENACAQISSGISASQQCEHTTPDSVKWLSGN